MRFFTYAFILSLFIFSNYSITQDSIDVEEIIVTATKTEKTLQEVPVAVSVVTADTIEKANIIDILDLKAVVPSLDTRQRTHLHNLRFLLGVLEMVITIRVLNPL